MFCNKITRLLRLRKCKMHKVNQMILVIIIIGIFCIIRPERILWQNSHLEITRSGSEETEDIAYKLRCLQLHSAGNKTECEEGAHHHLNDNGFNEITTRNELSGRKYNVDKKNKNITMDVDKEVKAIVKAYSERIIQVRAAENVTISSAIYREIPPVYDDLIKVTMDTKQQCKDASGYNAIIAVHTAPNNFRNRAAFRWLYGDFEKTRPRRFKLIFFIGLVSNATLQDRLKKENEQHDDMVQGNYIDAYINMTYKAIMVFDYLDNYCKGLRAFLRVDDDVFMNIQDVFTRWTYVMRSHPAKTIMCYRMKRDRVMRTGKWAVPRSLIPETTYEFMRCPGYFAAISVDLIHIINKEVRNMPFFWIDDIVILGLVPSTIPDMFFYPSNKWMGLPKHINDFENCIQTLGPKCSMWIGITKPENFEQFYGYISGRIPLIK